MENFSQLFQSIIFCYCFQSYFYKKENLLSGLIFNKENITIRPEYETVLRFYGYDLDGATNMLTESKMNETFGNTTGVTEAAADTTVITVENETKDEEESDTTTLQPETSDTTDEVSGTETNTEDNAQSDDVNEEVTTVAPPSRKRRGRLERGLKAKMNRRDRKQQTIKSPVK
jgi:hypothetical protein